MDFTDLYPTSSLHPPVFSPGSTFLATTHRSRIIIRHSLSLQVLQSFNLPPLSASPSPAGFLSRRSPSNTSPSSASAGPSTESKQEITSLSFSPDSERIIAVCARQNVAYVFQLGSMVEGDGLEAKLHGGVERLSRVEWAPSSLPGEGKTTLLAWSELGLRLTIYSLSDPDHRLVILNPRAPSTSASTSQSRMHQWSVDNRYLYVVERHNSKDSVAVYDSLSSYGLLARVTASFPIAGLSVSPSPIKPYFSIFAHPLEYGLSVHVPPMATPVVSLPPVQREGQPPWTSTGLGVRCAEWRPGGGWLAVAGWDGKIRLLDDREWATILILEPLRTTPSNANIWQEPTSWIASTLNRGIIPFHTLRAPQILSYTRPEPKSSPPTAGISILKWNMDGTLLLVQHANAPNVLIIYSFPLELRGQDEGVTVLTMAQPVKDTEWHPLQPRRLGWVCGTGGLFSWNGDWVQENEEGQEEIRGLAECIGIPNQPFSATSITYSPNGESVLLTDDGSTSGESAAVKGEATFLLVFEANEEEETLDGEGLAPVQEGESYVENDSFDSLAEDSFEQDLGRRSVGCQGEVAEGLSAVFEEADYSTVSA